MLCVHTDVHKVLFCEAVTFIRKKSLRSQSYLLCFLLMPPARRTVRCEWMCFWNNGCFLSSVCLVAIERSILQRSCCWKCCGHCWTSLPLAQFPTWGSELCIHLMYMFLTLPCLSFFPYSSFFFFHPPDLCLSVTTYTPTESISFYFFTPLCCISITRQNGYGLLLGSHLHISLSYIFQKVVRGLHSFSLLQWLFEQIGYTGAAEWGWYWDGVPSEQLIPSFFFLSEVIHAWLDKKPPLLSTKPACIWSSILQNHKGSQLYDFAAL